MQTSTKRKFSRQEDDRIQALVREYGTNAWVAIAGVLGNRTSRQCRERWRHYLSPGLNRGPWTPEEDGLLSQQYEIFGPKWAAIRDALPGRSDVAIKNRWVLTSKPTRKGRGRRAEPTRKTRPDPPRQHEDDQTADFIRIVFPVSPRDQSDYDE
jgi:hypothetical protein